MLKTITTLLSSHVINSIANFPSNTPKILGKYLQPAELCNTLASNMALKWQECFLSLTAQKESSVLIWPIETTPNLPSPIYWLEMVTTSKGDSVCEGKKTKVFLWKKEVKTIALENIKHTVFFMSWNYAIRE